MKNPGFCTTLHDLEMTLNIPILSFLHRGEVTLEPPVYANFVTTLEYIEDCNRKILNYGWVEFPLAYTQVATFSVYAYFFAALFGRQFLVPGSGNK